uniref:t-SNARE coiled-coil homology domain-containing protein n=1 Tax=Romanomermis culicivorax TaxID=13658 RepID=A0A915L2T2_ROMCU
MILTALDYLGPKNLAERSITTPFCYPVYQHVYVLGGGMSQNRTQSQHYLEKENDQMAEDMRTKVSALKQLKLVIDRRPYFTSGRRPEPEELLPPARVGVQTKLEITLQISDEVRQQNKMLGQLDEDFDSGHNMLGATMRRLETASNASYFAVFVPQKAGNDSQGDVFENFSEALAIVKKFKQHGARFKCFSDRVRADMYSKTGGELISENRDDISPGRRTSSYALRSLKKLSVETPTVVEEKPIPYEAPSRQDIWIKSQLTQFRKAIEQFDDDQIEELILHNPRYLVNCNSDSPTIIFEGCRYNALHVAAKCGNLFVCDLILKLLGADDFARLSSNSQYLRLLYPDDNDESLERRRKFLLDMFLNTPDKALHETPLHFAAKNSNWDVMRLLYSLPICDKLAKNKYGETAVALAKARASEDDNALFLRDSDCQMAKSSYVGLYRSDDCSILPFVKPPCIGFPPIVLEDETVYLSEEYTKVRRKRPENTEKSMRLSAYAGPMSHETANQFYIDWSSKRMRHLDTQDKRKNDEWKMKKYAEHIIYIQQCCNET